MAEPFNYKSLIAPVMVMIGTGLGVAFSSGGSMLGTLFAAILGGGGALALAFGMQKMMGGDAPEINSTNVGTANARAQAIAADALDNSLANDQLVSAQIDAVRTNVIQEAQKHTDNPTIASTLKTAQEQLMTQLAEHDKNLAPTNKEKGALTPAVQGIFEVSDIKNVSANFQSAENAMKLRYNDLKSDLEKVENYWTSYLLRSHHINPWADKTHSAELVVEGMQHLKHGRIPQAEAISKQLKETYIDPRKNFDDEAIDNAAKFVELIELRKLATNIAGIKTTCVIGCEAELAKIAGAEKTKTEQTNSQPAPTAETTKTPPEAETAPTATPAAETPAAAVNPTPPAAEATPTAPASAPASQPAPAAAPAAAAPAAETPTAPAVTTSIPKAVLEAAKAAAQKGGSSGDYVPYANPATEPSQRSMVS